MAAEKGATRSLAAHSVFFFSLRFRFFRVRVWTNKYIMEWLKRRMCREWGNEQQIKDFRENWKIYVFCGDVQCETQFLAIFHCLGSAGFDDLHTPSNRSGRNPGENAVLSILFEHWTPLISLWIRCMPSCGAHEEIVENFIAFQTEEFLYSGRITINFGLWCISREHELKMCLVSRPRNFFW